MSAVERDLTDGARTDGLDLAFSVFGEGGAPVVFLHGFGHNRAVWRQAAARLPEGYRAFCLDLRGHGASPWSTEGDYALEAHGDDLDRFFDAQGTGRAHVVAHSMGGQIALLFAARRPERIRSLTLVDTGPALRLDAAIQAFDAVGETLRVFDSPRAHRRALAALHPLADREALDALVEASLVRRIDGRFEFALDPGLLGEPGSVEDRRGFAPPEDALWEAYRGLDVPVCVMRGARSSILTAAHQDEMLRVAGRRARAAHFEAAGHAIMLDEPDRFAEVLIDFLTSIDGRAGTGAGTRPTPLR